MARRPEKIALLSSTAGNIVLQLQKLTVETAAFNSS
jgi:hypothetical protein